MFAYEQCLLCLGHHADIWLQAAQFLDERCIDGILHKIVHSSSFMTSFSDLRLPQSSNSLSFAFLSFADSLEMIARSSPCRVPTF